MRTHIHADRIITGRDSVLSDATLVVTDGEIETVDARENVDADADVEYDLHGCSVLPGLIDAHTHISSNDLSTSDVVMRSRAQIVVDTVRNLRTTIRSGVTTIRDVGSHADIPMVIDGAIDQDVFEGPRIVACGQGLTTTGGHGTSSPWHLTISDEAGIGHVADGVPAVQRGVREQLQRGADAIKAWVTGGAFDQSQGAGMQFSPEEVHAIADEAQRAGVYAAAHAHFPDAIRVCADAGFRTIEHGMYADQGSLDTMIENETYLCLTTAVMRAVAEAEDIPSAQQANAADGLKNLNTQLPDATEKGLQIGLGSEAGAPLVPHGQNSMELASLVELGFTPKETIEIATRRNAEMIGLGDTVGTLETGKAADVIAVEGNPLEDISTLTDVNQVEFVMVDGTPVVTPG